MTVQNTKVSKRTPRTSAASAEQVRLLDVDELAALLKVTKRTVYNMRSNGQAPPGTKIRGVGLRWSEAVVQEWMRTQMQVAS